MADPIKVDCKDKEKMSKELDNYAYKAFIMHIAHLMRKENADKVIDNEVIE